MRTLLLTTGAIITATTLNAGTVIPIITFNHWGNQYTANSQDKDNPKYSYEDNECQSTCWSWNGVLYDNPGEPLALANTELAKGIINQAAIVKYVPININKPVIRISEEEYLENNAENIASTGTLLVAVPGNYVGDGTEENQYGGITFFNELAIPTNTFAGTKYLWNDTLYDSPGEAAVAQVTAAANITDGVVDEDYLNSSHWTQLEFINGKPPTPEHNALNIPENKLMYETQGYTFLNIPHPSAELGSIGTVGSNAEEVEVKEEPIKPSESLSSAYIFQQVVNEYAELRLRGEVGKQVLQLSKDVFAKGYDNGFEDGYDQGYKDGYKDGFIDGVNSVINSTN